jgi:hypothetical protein
VQLPASEATTACVLALAAGYSEHTSRRRDDGESKARAAKIANTPGASKKGGKKGGKKSS